MEASQPLAIESFSFSWSINRKSSFDNVSNNSSESTSEEPKNKMTPSNTYSEHDHNFNFDIPMLEPLAASLVHADEIFSNGHIMPIYIDHRPKLKSSIASNSIPTTPLSSLPLKPITPSDKIIRYRFIKKWRQSSTRILNKYFGFLNPFWRKLGRSRKNTRVGDIEGKEWEVKSCSTSEPQLLPSSRLITSCSASDICNISKSSDISDNEGVLRKAQSWSNSAQQSQPCSSDWCDVESSIYEAILHCKRSIEK